MTQYRVCNCYMYCDDLRITQGYLSITYKTDLRKAKLHQVQRHREWLLNIVDKPSILGLLGGLILSSCSPWSGVKLVIRVLEPMEAVGTTHTQHNFYTNTQQQQQYQNEHFIQSKETTYTNVNTKDKQIHRNYGVHKP